MIIISGSLLSVDDLKASATVCSLLAYNHPEACALKVGGSQNQGQTICLRHSCTAKNSGD